MNKQIDIIGIPLDLGANLRGACMGPAAIRIAELHTKLKALDLEVFDRGDIYVPIRETLEKPDIKHNFRSIIINTANALAQIVENSLKNEHLPICIGGDHSLALGSIAGVSKFYRDQNKSFGLIWVDAHADINTYETSPTGNIHGMPLAALLGLGDPDLTKIYGFCPKIKAENVVIIGIRTLDGQEKITCRNSGIKYFTMREVDERGMSSIAKEAVDHISKKCSAIHLSLDIDSIDPLYAPGVSTPETGGLSYREAHLLLEIIADSKKLVSMDIAELNPAKDIDNKTSRLAVELIQSALGKSII
ncbi:MAG: arginase [Oligoflexales bacterium]|nr:arginase [Oligoflexales bacterium]